jgi:drug/metabolite transporter (DMT)-like permease
LSKHDETDLCQTRKSSVRAKSGTENEYPMLRRPAVACGSAIAAGSWILISTIAVVRDTTLFLAGIVSGILILSLGALLFIRPRNHSVWGALLGGVSLVDIIGSVLFFYAPGNGVAALFTPLAASGPIVALIGGIAALLWKLPVEVQPSR